MTEIKHFQGVIGTFMGRDALSLAVSFLDLDADDTILLPAYLCEVVLKPFLGKSRVKFYDLQPDLTIDPEEIKIKLAQDNVKIILIINYFGFLQPYRRELRKLCADKGIIIIEDCAHSLLTEGSGEIGDLSIYSFAKILPVPDGGGLKLNMEGKAITPVFYPRIYSNFLSVLIILKALFKVQSDILSRAWVASQKQDDADSTPCTKKNNRTLPLSLFAYKGIGKAPLAEIVEKRRSDYQFWQSMAERTKLFTPIFSELSSGVCPLGYPIKIKDRDLLKSRLQKEDIFLKIHWHLPDLVGKEFVNSQTLSKKTITLPVYPELSQKDREVIQRVLTT